MTEYNPMTAVGLTRPNPLESTQPNVMKNWQITTIAPFRDYFNLYRAELARLGITLNDIVENVAQLASPTYHFTMSKFGFDAPHMLGFKAAFETGPITQARKDYENVWGWKYSYETGNYLDQRPDTGVAQANNSTPGPAQTVTNPPANLQQQQSNPAPVEGTLAAPVVTNPAFLSTHQGEMLNIDEWNWYYKAETGLSGPAPESLGIIDRTKRFSRAEYLAMIQQTSTQAASGIALSSGAETSGFDGLMAQYGSALKTIAEWFTIVPHSQQDLSASFLSTFNLTSESKVTIKELAAISLWREAKQMGATDEQARQLLTSKGLSLPNKGGSAFTLLGMILQYLGWR